MEYEFRSGSAAYALPEARATFIRKTYAHLAYALLGFAVLEYALLNFPGHEVLVGYLTYEWWLALLLFIVVGWVADLLGALGGFEGASVRGARGLRGGRGGYFLPLLYVAVEFTGDPTLVPVAALVTGLLFLGLTVVAFTTRADFFFLRSIIFISGLVAFGPDSREHLLRVHARRDLLRRNVRAGGGLHPVRHFEHALLLPHRPVRRRLSLAIRRRRPDVLLCAQDLPHSKEIVS